MMKLLVVVVVLGVFVGCAHQADQEKVSEADLAQIEKILKHRAECIEQTKVDPKLIERIEEGDFISDPKLHCFTKCFYQKTGFVDDKGELLWDVIRDRIPKESDREKALAVFEKCKGLKGADSCETVYLVHKCHFENTYKKEKNGKV